MWHQTHYNVTDKEIAPVLIVSTHTITSMIAFTGLTVIISVSTFITAVILYTVNDLLLATVFFPPHAFFSGGI